MAGVSVETRDGIISHTVASPYQAQETKIDVLVPDGPRGAHQRMLLVLPVEPFDGSQCGDALAEVRRHDLHNKHQLVCVKPTFSHAPWYADHPRDPGIRQESHLLKVVLPLINETYFPELEPPRPLLAGFSKSGWGAFSLLLRSPDLFLRAAAFDAPLAWETPNRYGMGEVFETEANMDRYCVHGLLQKTAATWAGAGASRFGLFGFSEFRGHHQFLHYRMLSLGIPHEYADGPRRDHRWDSGWLPEAVAFLTRD
jgi:hypothetical protein